MTTYTENLTDPPGDLEWGGLVLVCRPKAHPGRAHIDVLLSAELDAEPNLIWCDTDEDEDRFGDGLCGPVGRDEACQLQEASVAVSACLALVEEVLGAELLEACQVRVRLCGQAERVAGGFDGHDVVVSFDEFDDLVAELDVSDFRIAVAEQIAYDGAQGHRLRREPAGTLSCCDEFSVDRLFCQAVGVIGHWSPRLSIPRRSRR